VTAPVMMERGLESFKTPLRQRKLVQASDGVGNSVNNKQLGDPFERDPLDGGAKTLLIGLNQTLDFSNVTVSENEIHVNQTNLLHDKKPLNKLLIGVNINNVETAGAEVIDNQLKLAEDGIMYLIRNGCDRAETNVPHNFHI
jgi:hypothetical protein